MVVVLPEGSIIEVEDTKENLMVYSEYMVTINGGTVYPDTVKAGTIALYHGSFATTPLIDDVKFNAGDEFYCTADSKFYKFNGTDWIPLN